MGIDPFNDEAELEAMKIKQLIFVKHEGEWVFVIQMVALDFADRGLAGANVIQYVSYPSSTAAQMSENEAIQYVNTILDLASEAQR